MDIKTAFRILNLNPGSSFQDAKTAYRNLAKKYHPDVVQRKPDRKSSAEARMKEINLAFCYLAPLLKSMKAGQKTREEKKVETPREKRSPRVVLKFIKILFSIFKGEKHNSGFEQNPGKEKIARKAKDKIVRFDDVFKKIYQGPQKRGKQTGHQKDKKYSQKTTSYKSYQKYMRLKKRMRSGSSGLNQDISIGRIEKISPVQPVKPVGKN